jgi:seryl-tRNA synthetase
MVITCIILGALLAAGAAQASDSSVRAAIETSGKQIKENGELQQALTEIKDNPKTIAKLQKGLKEFETALTKVVTTVEAQEASTPAGKEGEEDWTGGIRDVVKGFKDLGTALGDLEAGHKGEAKAELKKAGVLVKEGAAEAKKGKTLLGVK